MRFVGEILHPCSTERSMQSRASRTIAVSILALLASAGCTRSSVEEQSREQVRARLLKQEGLAVKGTVDSVKFMPASHLDWPKESLSRALGETFARAELRSGQCVIVGPSLSLRVQERFTVRGV